MENVFDMCFIWEEYLLMDWKWLWNDPGIVPEGQNFYPNYVGEII